MQDWNPDFMSLDSNGTLGHRAAVNCAVVWNDRAGNRSVDDSYLRGRVSGDKAGVKRNSRNSSRAKVIHSSFTGCCVRFQILVRDCNDFARRHHQAGRRVFEVRYGNRVLGGVAHVRARICAVWGTAIAVARAGAARCAAKQQAAEQGYLLQASAFEHSELPGLVR